MEYSKNTFLNNTAELKIIVDSVNSNLNINTADMNIKVLFGASSFKTEPDSIVLLGFQKGSTNNVLLEPLSTGIKKVRIKSSIIITGNSNTIDSLSVFNIINPTDRYKVSKTLNDHTITIEVKDDKNLGLTNKTWASLESLSAIIGLPAIIMFLITSISKFRQRKKE